MEPAQEKARPTLEVLRVGGIEVSDGILSIPLHVNVLGASPSEGDILLILKAPLAEELSSKLQARTPQAVRQWHGKA